MKGEKVSWTSVKKSQSFLALVLNQVSLQKWFFYWYSFIWGKGAEFWDGCSAYRTRVVGRKRNLIQNVPSTITTNPGKQVLLPSVEWWQTEPTLILKYYCTAGENYLKKCWPTQFGLHKPQGSKETPSTKFSTPRSMQLD